MNSTYNEVEYTAHDTRVATPYMYGKYRVITYILNIYTRDGSHTIFVCCPHSRHVAPVAATSTQRDCGVVAGVGAEKHAMGHNPLPGARPNPGAGRCNEGRGTAVRPLEASHMPRLATVCAAHSQSSSTYHTVRQLLPERTIAPPLPPRGEGIRCTDTMRG